MMGSLGCTLRMRVLYIGDPFFLPKVASTSSNLLYPIYQWYFAYIERAKWGGAILGPLERNCLSSISVGAEEFFSLGIVSQSGSYLQ